LVKSQLEGDRDFVDNDLLNFSHKLDLLSNLEKEKQGLPDTDWMKHIKFARSEKIRTLDGIIFECGDIENRRENTYVKAITIVRDLNCLCVTYVFGLILKDRLMAELEKLKQS